MQAPIHTLRVKEACVFHNTSRHYLGPIGPWAIWILLGPKPHYVMVDPLDQAKVCPSLVCWIIVSIIQAIQPIVYFRARLKIISLRYLQLYLQGHCFIVCGNQRGLTFLRWNDMQFQGYIHLNHPRNLVSTVSKPKSISTENVLRNSNSSYELRLSISILIQNSNYD